MDFGRVTIRKDVAHLDLEGVQLFYLLVPLNVRLDKSLFC